MQAAENYDWRLSIVDLERRDNYFTILQNRVELLHSTNSEKVRQLHLHVSSAEGNKWKINCHQGCHIGRLQALTISWQIGVAERAESGVVYS